MKAGRPRLRRAVRPPAQPGKFARIACYTQRLRSMDTSDVVVIIPCYNSAAFLNDALDSVLQQTHPVSTVIVVDDASTDASVAIVDAYAAKGFPVRSVALTSNRGPATARNEGMAQSTAPFVTFLDADDRWSKDHCASLVALLLEHPEAYLAFSRCRSTDPLMPGSPLPVPTAQPLDMVEELLDDSFIPQSVVMARRTRFATAGDYLEGMRYSEDCDLWLRMVHGRKFIASPEPTCIRTSHLGQVARDDANMTSGSWEARARCAGFAARHGQTSSGAWMTRCS